MEKFDVYSGEFPSKDWEHVRDLGEAGITVYRKGAQVRFVRRPCAEPSVERKRGAIKDQSRVSRHRAAFALGNAECDWLATTLLTWREIPAREEVKRSWRRFSDRWRDRWGEPVCAWILEMQQRGAPHFHLFHAAQSNFGLQLQAGEIGSDHGSQSEHFHGCAVAWLINAWLDCIGATDRESRSFMARGCTERMRSPDAAGRYAAKEAAKREQKILPEWYADGVGRWWHLARRWKPIARYHGWIDLDWWPWEHPISHVWDANELTPAILRLLEIPPSSREGQSNE